MTSSTKSETRDDDAPAGMTRVSKAVFYATVGPLNAHPCADKHRTFWRAPSAELLGITTPGYLAEGECAYFVAATKTVPVTGAEVKAAVEAAGLSRIDHHECGGCGYMTAYLVQSGRLYFSPGCNCGRWADPEPRSWDDAANWINMQSRYESRAGLLRRFGFPEAR